MKDDFDQYKKFLEKENPQIYKKNEKIFGISQEESRKNPEEKMNMNPFYWYHQFKQKAVDIFSTHEKYKLLDKAETKMETTYKKPSKVSNCIY